MPLPNKINTLIENRQDLITRAMILGVGFKGEAGVFLRWQLNENNQGELMKYDHFLEEISNAVQNTRLIRFLNNEVLPKMFSENEGFAEKIEQQKQKLIEREQKIVLEGGAEGPDIFEVEQKLHQEILDYISKNTELNKQFNNHIDDVYTNIIAERTIAAENPLKAAKLIMNAVRTHEDKVIDSDEKNFITEKLNAAEFVKFFEEVVATLKEENPNFIQEIKTSCAGKPDKIDRKINEKVLEYVEKSPTLSEKLLSFINDMKLKLGIGGDKKFQQKFYQQREAHEKFESFSQRLANQAKNGLER